MISIARPLLALVDRSRSRHHVPWLVITVGTDVMNPAQVSRLSAAWAGVADATIAPASASSGILMRRSSGVDAQGPTTRARTAGQPGSRPGVTPSPTLEPAGPGPI